MICHSYGIPLLWCVWHVAGTGGVGRYQTDTWHASQAMSGHGARICFVNSAHTHAPHWAGGPMVPLPSAKGCCGSLRWQPVPSGKVCQITFFFVQ